VPVCFSNRSHCFVRISFRWNSLEVARFYRRQKGYPFLTKWLISTCHFFSQIAKKFFAERTFWQQQRHSITGDADVKFSFVVFTVCTLLALSIACTGSLPDCMAVVVAI
jgi:hypothetical protein